MRASRPSTPAARTRGECVEWLDALFAERDLDEWREILDAFEGEWVPVQHPYELPDDAQVKANRYIADVDLGDGTTVPMVASPVQFDGQPNRPTRAARARRAHRGRAPRVGPVVGRHR